MPCWKSKSKSYDTKSKPPAKVEAHPGSASSKADGRNGKVNHNDSEKVEKAPVNNDEKKTAALNISYN